ncbi:hypothetical protein CVT24_001858 [Panaeolus cyanescens]|uniref:DUF6533 domain-containing protein n=1 Tax=Panaeolus cyanescens TaxID=181874 RepID=A0A409YEV4_9AGAR|nr:hypothetical protein CVT24_001858 [Panaeolus cyanescens]
MSVANPNAQVLDHHLPHRYTGEEWDLSVDRLNAVFMLNACAVAALTWVVYDFVLSFGEEISLVWNRWHNKRGQHARRLYIFIRYFSVINLCNATAITLAPDAMILLRINAVYHYDVFGELDRFFLEVQIFLKPFSRTFISVLSLTICLFATAQCVYFILMLITLLHVMRGLDVRGRASAESLKQVRKLVPTMMVFISHGTYYFFFAILAKIVNAILIVTASGPLREIGIPWIMALYPVLVTKIYLNMVQYLHGRRGRIQYLHNSPNPGAGGDDENHDNFHFTFSFNSSSDDHTMPGFINERDAERGGGSRRGSSYFRTGLGQITFATRSSLAVSSDVDSLGEDL